MSTLPVPASPMHPAMPMPGGMAPGMSAAAPSGMAFDLRFLSAVLRRRWLLLSTTIIAITATAAGYALTREPIYAATAKLLMGVPQSTAVDLANLVGGLPVTTERIQNEIQILQSRELARKVVVAAGLDRHPDYNPAIEPAPAAPTVRERVEEFLPEMPSFDELATRFGLDAWLSGMAPDADMIAQPESDPLRPVVDRYLGDLLVWPEGRSHVINVSFEARDPLLAASVANVVAQTYLEDRLGAKLEAAERTSGWLEQRITALRVDAEAKEEAVEAYRSRTGLVAGQGAGLTFERIAQLNQELAVAKGAELEVGARYAKVQDALETTGVAALPEVLASPTIQELRRAHTVVESQRAELSRQLGPRHPRMIDVQAQLESLRSQIRVETGRVLDSIRNAYEVARNRSARLAAEMDALEHQIRNRNDAEAELRVLEREAEAAQDVYRTFLMRANASSQQEGLETADGRLISAAEIPNGAIGPNRRLLVMLGFAFSCFVGLGLIVGRELMDRRFKTVDQIRTRLRVPVLGVVPMLGSLTRTGRAPQDHVIDGPDGAFGEAIRSLRTNLLLSGRDPAPRSLLLTSSVQGEGKTTLSLTIGRHSALSGLKTVVIDCDFRRPRVHSGLGAENGPGVIDFLRGAPLGEVTRIDRHSGLHFISAGSWRPNAPELLRHPRMGELISLLSTRYDLVLIDTPPLLPVSDASVIAGLADMAVLVVGWNNARPESVDLAVERLRQSAGNARLSAIFNNVDVHKVAAYGSAEIAAYSGRYSSYYAAA